MKFLFKKRKVSQGQAVPEWGDKIAGKVAGGILSIQQKWADWMQRKTEQFSLRTKKIVFASFFTIQAAVCIGLIAGVSPWPASTQEPAGKFQASAPDRSLHGDTIIKDSIRKVSR